MPTKNYYLSQETDEVERQFVDEMVKEIAPKYGLETALVMAIIKQESGFEIFSRRYDYKPLSTQKWHSEAMVKYGFKGKEFFYSSGLMQVLYIVCRLDYGFQGGFYDLFDPKINIEYGCKILAKQIARYGDIQKAISAYNAGTYTTGNYKSYVEPVYTEYKRLGGIK